MVHQHGVHVMAACAVSILMLPVATCHLGDTVPLQKGSPAPAALPDVSKCLTPDRAAQRCILAAGDTSQPRNAVAVVPAAAAAAAARGRRPRRAGCGGATLLPLQIRCTAARPERHRQRALSSNVTCSMATQGQPRAILVRRSCQTWHCGQTRAGQTRAPEQPCSNLALTVTVPNPCSKP